MSALSGRRHELRLFVDYDVNYIIDFRSRIFYVSDQPGS